MTAPVGGVPGVPPRRDNEALRKAAHALEGLFLRQMLAAMRETVPEGEFSTPGAEMFTAMMDDQLADRAAELSGRGPGEALYRQLAARLRAAQGGEPSAP